jgi:phage baseplate assembly protein V
MKAAASVTLEDHIVALRMEVERLRRLVPRLMRYGTVSEVDAPRARARMLVNDPDSDVKFCTPWRPWAELAGQTRTWRPPAVGQQMLLFSPSGQLRQSIMLPAMFSDTFTQPSQDGGANRDVFGSVVVDMEKERWGVTAPQVDLGASGGKPVARIGDKVDTPAGPGTIVEGSSKVFAAD